MQEAYLELANLRCPNCAGDLVLRVLGEERGRSVQLTLDTACASCGTSPFREPDQRMVVFTPGAPLSAALAGVALGESPLLQTSTDAAVRLEAAQARIESLQRRCAQLEAGLQAAQHNLGRAGAEERRKQQQGEGLLRGEISRLEGALAEARAEVRRADEATHGEVREGKRAIELE